MKKWIVLVAGYGAMLITGTRKEADDIRKHKARHEQAVAMLRPASKEETEDNISMCLNHKLFNRDYRYVCKCGEC